MAVSYNGLWKLLIDKKNEESGYDEPGGNQQQHRGKNDQ